jgi:hypothetical protein
MLTDRACGRIAENIIGRGLLGAIASMVDDMDKWYSSC